MIRCIGWWVTTFLYAFAFIFGRWPFDYCICFPLYMISCFWAFRSTGDLIFGDE